MVGSKNSKEYRLWSNIFNRVYSNKADRYTLCSVDPQWYNFQEFAEWCQWQVGFGRDGWEIDKDILRRGNMVYGPDKCCFVPRQINATFIASYRAKGYSVSPYNTYRAAFKANHEVIDIGTYKTTEEAAEAYRASKKRQILYQLSIWGDQLDERVRQRLINYEVETV